MPYVSERDLDSMAALIAAEGTRMCKYKGERDTEFVKRIVAAYLNAKHEMEMAESLGGGTRN